MLKYKKKGRLFMVIKRTRTFKKNFWFNEDENNALAKLSNKVGKSESYVVRNLVLDCTLKEKPDKEFYEFIKLLQKISNNINQIAVKAHALGFVDELAYKREVDRLDNFMDEIKEKYLYKKDSGKNDNYI